MKEDCKYSAIQGMHVQGHPLFFIGRYAKYLEKRRRRLVSLERMRRIQCNRLLSWQEICINESVEDDDIVIPFKLKPEPEYARFDRRR
jgi:hypothetical protein